MTYSHEFDNVAMIIDRLNAAAAKWRERAQKAEAERDDLAKKVYVPGLWKCAKCGFTLVQRVLRASDGAVGVRDEAGENCPNDGAPLWRVSERDAGNEAADRASEYLDRAQKAERERDEARRERDEARRDRAALYDKLNGTPCAEVRWQQERDALRALIARAGEAVEPFANAYGKTPFSETGPLASDYAKTWELTTKDFRRLAALAAELRKAGEDASPKGELK